MLKDDFPVYFDETEISINKRQWRINKGNIITQNTTEAGTEDIEILRFGKTSISAQFRCTDEWTSTLMAFASQPSVTVKFYDPEIKTYATKVMHMDGVNVAQTKYSDELDVTNGIYDISFTLVEF